MSQFGITPEQKNNCDSYFYLGEGDPCFSGIQI